MIRRVKTALYVLTALAIIYVLHPSSTSLGPRYVEWKEEDAMRVKEGARMVRFDTPQGHGMSLAYVHSDVGSDGSARPAGGVGGNGRRGSKWVS
jgi:hypothetical protein